MSAYCISLLKISFAKERFSYKQETYFLLQLCPRSLVQALVIIYERLYYNALLPTHFRVNSLLHNHLLSY